MSDRLEMKVVYEDPTKLSVPTLFSNHIGISRAGTEVQFEFVSLDINALATTIGKYKTEPAAGPLEVTGKTVAKIVVPLHVFMQLEQHLKSLFVAVKQEFPVKNNQNEGTEVTDERNAII